MSVVFKVDACVKVPRKSFMPATRSDAPGDDPSSMNFANQSPRFGDLSIPLTSYHTFINPRPFFSHQSSPTFATENLHCALLQSHLTTPQHFLPDRQTEVGAIRATTHQLYTLSSSCKFTSNPHLRMQQRNRHHEQRKASPRFEAYRR